MHRVNAIRAMSAFVLLIVMISGPDRIVGTASPASASSSPASRGGGSAASSSDSAAPQPSAVAAHRPASLIVYPSVISLRGREARQQMIVLQRRSDGTVHDVTGSVHYRSLNSRIADVSAGGIVVPRMSGRTHIEVQSAFGNVLVPVRTEKGERFLPLDFRRDIVPVFTRLGCNGGGCHGKSTGRGGLKLSLFGYEPQTGYESIRYGERGRRVFPADPDRSLLLQKPLMKVPHGGGRRWTQRDPEYQLVRRWIAEGLPWGGRAAALQGIEVFPPSRMMHSGEQQRLAVTALYADGSRRDVSRLAIFRSNDVSLVEVSPQGVLTAGPRHGETAIVVQYQGQITVCTVTVPVTDPQAPTPALPTDNPIDRAVLAKLQTLRIPPSPTAEDSVFLRRATLQIAGRLPTVSETRTFLSDKDPNKRKKLIDRLLNDPGYADMLAQIWSALLRNKRRGQPQRLAGTKAFHNWIRDSFARNRAYDEFVRAILTAEGNVKDNPPVQWYAEVRYLDRYVDDTAQVFLGLRIGCARCHHHPFESFSQDDYFGLAAFFARVGRTGGTGAAERAANEIIFVNGTGEVKHPVTGSLVQPRGLGEDPLDIPPCEDPRTYLADWMTAPENPYFAKAFVNRLWAHFFGKGIVEPRDDLRSTNPPANTALLETLARAFVASGYDVKHMVRLICTSATYARSSDPNRWNLEETRMNSRFLPQRLDAEVLLDAIDALTGVPTEYPGLPVGTRALQLPDEGFSNRFLRMYGRPERASACECERDNAPTLRRSLFLMNDPFLLKKIYHEKGTAAKLARDRRPPKIRIAELFLRAFSRPPTPAEEARALRYLQDAHDSREAWGDLLWALINTNEFQFVR